MSIFSIKLSVMCRPSAGNKRPQNNETEKRPGVREPAGSFWRLDCVTGGGLNGGQIRKNHDYEPIRRPSGAWKMSFHEGYNG